MSSDGVPQGWDDAKKQLDRFEEAWQSGDAPRLDDFLPARRPVDGPGGQRLLEELVKVDLEYRWRRSADRKTGPCLEDYSTRHAELSRPELDLIGWEYFVRQRWGDRPRHDEYAARFPGHGANLRAMLAQMDARLAAECSRERGPARLVPRPREGPPTLGKHMDLVQPPISAAALLAALRDCQLLDTGQLADLTRSVPSRFSEARVLGRELLQRGWLTPYQVNQLLQGQGADLVRGPYLLLERLGEGGAGQVFKARHQKMNRVVALKVIRKELLADAEAVARFYREIQVVSQLDHANVVHAFDAGPVGQTHFLAMEYVEGTDLGRLVKQGGPLPVQQACEYIRQAALGLQHAHERGLVHRDIKPHNLIMSVREGLIKVADLGLARLPRAVNEEATAVLGGGAKSTGTLTPENAVMIGTADYLAPEQAIDFHGADIRADLYSLGCTFYFLLAGQPPFAGGMLAQKLLKHQQAGPPPLTQFRRDVPASVESVLRRLMAKKPEQRFQTPADAAAALAPFAQAGTGPRSQTGRFLSWSRSIGPSTRKHWRALAATAGVALLAVLLYRFVLTPATGSSPAAVALQRLQADAQNPKADPVQLWDAAIRVRLRYPGTAEAREAAILLLALPSPLDQLGGEPREAVAVVGKEAQLKASVLALSPDDRTVVTGTVGDKATVRLWDLVSGKELAPLTDNQVSVASIVFSADGKWLAAALANDRRVRVWNLKVREAPLTLASKGLNSCVAFSGDARLLAAGFEDGTVKLWDTGTWQERASLPPHKPQPLNCLAFTPDSQILAGGSQDTAVDFWDVAAARSAAYSPEMPRTHWIAFAPNGRTIACVGNIADQLWEVVPGARPALRKTLSGSGSDFAAFTADGKLLITASLSMSGISIYDMAKDGQTLASWPLLPNQKLGAGGALALDGRHLVLLSNGTVSVVRLFPAPKR